jgi:putative tryptophan/tyrosine transport system substrate-binding protein
MRRREFIMLSGGVAVAWPCAVRAQQTERMRSVGVLFGSVDDVEGQARAALLRQGFSELGWTEGRNIHIDYRWIGGDTARAKANAVELVNQKPDVIIANTTLSLAAVRDETSTIPIVFVAIGDPIAQGFVSSLAHPGGNITGFTSFEFAISAKWLGLIKEIAPELARVAFIFNPEAAPFAGKFVQPIERAAPSFGVDLIVSPIRDAAEIDRVLAAVSGEPKGGLIVEPDAFTAANRGLIISLAARYRLPAIYPYRFYAAEGGLLSYGNDFNEMWRRAPSYVDKILKGASPGDLPIQQPTKFELIINLKTAKALWFDHPAAVAQPRRRSDRIATLLLQSMSPLLAQSGHRSVVRQCPLLGVKRTSGGGA